MRRGWSFASAPSAPMVANTASSISIPTSTSEPHAARGVSTLIVSKRNRLSAVNGFEDCDRAV